MRVDFRYWSLVIEKKECPDTLSLEGRIHKEITGFVRGNLDFFQSFDRVVLYYDNGQHQLNRILNMVLGTELSGYEIKKVLPADYRLFQVADMICTLKLMERKIEHSALSRSEQLIFHSKKEFKKGFPEGNRQEAVLTGCRNLRRRGPVRMRRPFLLDNPVSGGYS